jgi:large subunit ribosomal protein L27
MSRLRELLCPIGQATANCLAVQSKSRCWTSQWATFTFVRTATKKAAGSRTSMKDSAGRRLGMKRSDGQPVKAGEIIYRQRGTKFYPGENTGIGKDHTIWASEPGYVRYYYDPFHPKRRLIGVALGTDEKLPTPHFAPRRRRLGYVPIENEKLAQRERERLSRKETLALPKVLEEVHARENRRLEKAVQMSTALSSFISDLGQDELKTSSERLVKVSNYFAGGRTIAEARKFVDNAYVQDTRLSAEQKKISTEDAEAAIKDYLALSEKVDSVVSFSPDMTLCNAYTEAELVDMKEQALQSLKALSGNPLTEELKSQMMTLIQQPCFDLSTRVKLRRRYTRSERPILIKDEESLTEVQKLEKAGDGKIVKSWNYERRKVQRFYLPNGTSLFALR